MTWFSPFEHEFMRTALLMAVLVGTVCAVFSCFLVLRGWSLMGDAVAHAVLPGIVVAYWAGLPLSVGAFGSGLLCAVGSGYIRSRSRVKEDTVLGVVFTGLFGLGLVLFTKVESDQHLNHILFGNLLGIPKGELLRTWITGLGTLCLILLRHREDDGLLGGMAEVPGTEWLPEYAIFSLLHAEADAPLKAEWERLDRPVDEPGRRHVHERRIRDVIIAVRVGEAARLHHPMMAFGRLRSVFSQRATVSSRLGIDASATAIWACRKSERLPPAM